MERLDADAGAAERPLDETPEVLDPVGVDLAAQVGLGVVDNQVLVVRVEALVRGQFVGDHGGLGLDVPTDLTLRSRILHALHADRM